MKQELPEKPTRWCDRCSVKEEFTLHKDGKAQWWIKESHDCIKELNYRIESLEMLLKERNR